VFSTGGRALDASCPHLRQVMIDLSFLEPVRELLKDQEFRDQIDETARIFFSNNAVTINLIPALIAGILASLLLLPLIGIPILDILGNSMASITGGGGGYGGGYGGGGGGGGATTGYGYVARAGDNTYYEQTIADLQEQVTSLQESEASLRNAVYYSNPVEGAQSSNNIGYSS
jgi:hypothetical protein